MQQHKGTLLSFFTEKGRRLLLAITFATFCMSNPAQGSSETNNAPALHKHLCLEDDYTNDLPIFIERQTICNFESTPVHIYAIKIMPDNIENKYCLKGENAEKFRITDDKEIKLYDRLSQPETNLRLQIIRTSNDIVGTPTERRQAINAIQFNLNLVECNQVSWQTIVVAILSSACVALMSSLAIMLILYQQRGLIKSTNDDEKGEERVQYPAANVRDESFINPRRTSSYEFSTMSRNSASTLERQETENL